MLCIYLVYIYIVSMYIFSIYVVCMYVYSVYIEYIQHYVLMLFLTTATTTPFTITVSECGF